MLRILRKFKFWLLKNADTVSLSSKSSFSLLVAMGVVQACRAEVDALYKERSLLQGLVWYGASASSNRLRLISFTRRGEILRGKRLATIYDAEGAVADCPGMKT